MRRSVRNVIGAAGLGALLLASGAHADPTISISSPAAGSTFSRAEFETIPVAGTVNFDPPVASTRKFFVRRDDCGGTDNPRLSAIAGADGGDGCGDLRSGVPQEAMRTAGQSEWPGFGDAFEEFAAVDGVPLVLQAGKIKGQLSYEGDGAQAGLGKVEVQVMANGTMLGTATSQQQMDPNADHTDYPWEFNVPAGSVGTSLESLSLRVLMRGVMVIESGGFMRLNGESWLDVPYLDSGAVQVATSASFPEGSTATADVAPDGTWSAEVDTPSSGSKKIYARAVQGSKTVVTNVGITVKP